MNNLYDINPEILYQPKKMLAKIMNNGNLVNEELARLSIETSDCLDDTDNYGILKISISDGNQSKDFTEIHLVSDDNICYGILRYSYDQYILGYGTMDVYIKIRDILRNTR